LAQQNANHLPTKILGGWQNHFLASMKTFMEIAFFADIDSVLMPTKSVGIANRNLKMRKNGF